MFALISVSTKVKKKKNFCIFKLWPEKNQEGRNFVAGGQWILDNVDLDLVELWMFHTLVFLKIKLEYTLVSK